MPADLNDWAAAGSLGLTAIALVALAVAFADAAPADFDPRPALRRAAESAHHIQRDTAITAAALLMLLTATPEATR